MSLKKFVWNGSTVKSKADSATPRGLLRCAEHVLEGAQREVPIEDSDLTKSGSATVDPVKKRAAVSYGDALSGPYAVYQHETMGLHHDPGRKAKYLEDPLNAANNDGSLMAIFASEYRSELT